MGEQLKGQMSIFDFIEDATPRNPGDWLEPSDIGRELSFDELPRMIGRMVAVDKSIESHWGAKAVRIEKVVKRPREKGRRAVVYYDGGRLQGIIDEMYFDKNYPHPSRMWELKGKD